MRVCTQREADLLLDVVQELDSDIHGSSGIFEGIAKAIKVLADRTDQLQDDIDKLRKAQGS